MFKSNVLTYCFLLDDCSKCLSSLLRNPTMSTYSCLKHCTCSTILSSIYAALDLKWSLAMVITLLFPSSFSLSFTSLTTCFSSLINLSYSSSFYLQYLYYIKTSSINSSLFILSICFNFDELLGDQAYWGFKSAGRRFDDISNL